jgi:hypothetical protein
VSITVAADPAESLGSVQAYLRYNDKVTHGTLPSGIGVTVTRENDGLRLFISRLGEAVSADAGGAAVVSIPFTAIEKGGAVFGIEDPKVSKAADPSSMLAANAGGSLTMAITEAQAPGPITFDTSYAGAPNGYKLLKYALDAKPAVQYTYGEDGETMHYARIGGSHYVTYIVANGVTAESAAAVTATLISAAENDGDTNGDGTLEIVDAQIAYDIGEGAFANDTNFETLTIEQRLKADFDGNGEVNLIDAYKIQYKLHGLIWYE